QPLTKSGRFGPDPGMSLRHALLQQSGSKGDRVPTRARKRNSERSPSSPSPPPVPAPSTARGLFLERRALDREERSEEASGRSVPRRELPQHVLQDAAMAV